MNILKIKYPNKILGTIIISLLFIGLEKKLVAQPFSLSKLIKPIELKMEIFKPKDSIYNGKINITNVVQKEDTNYYYVKGAGIYQPVHFKILAVDKSKKIKVFLAKNNWNKADRTGTTNNDGVWKMLFRTEGSFGIMIVTPAKNMEYNLRIWIGNEPKKMKLPTPFVK